MARGVLGNVAWLGHASFRIVAADKVIYIDPWRITGGVKADLVLITHEHHDHCSPEDVAKIQVDETVIITTLLASDKLTGDIRVIEPGQWFELTGTVVEAIPAYNVDKFRSPGVPFHPKEHGGVGFVISVEGQRVYHAGDTDVVPEMKEVRTDIALLPVSGRAVTTAEEAAQAAVLLRPQIAVPMHYGSLMGSIEDALRFKELCPMPVKILDQISDRV